MSSLVYPDLPGLSLAVHRIPVYATLIQAGATGAEQRATFSSCPKYRYQLKYEFLRSDAAWNEFQKLFGFIARHLGRYSSFLFVDPDDCTVTDHPFGYATSGLTYQLQRTFVPSADLNGGATRTYWPADGDGYEPVYILNGTPTIKAAGVALVATTDYAVSSSGLVTLTAAQTGKILTWSGSFYRRCRFNSDETDAEQIVKRIWKTGSIELVTVLS